MNIISKLPKPVQYWLGFLVGKVQTKLQTLDNGWILVVGTFVPFIVVVLLML